MSARITDLLNLLNLGGNVISLVITSTKSWSLIICGSEGFRFKFERRKTFHKICIDGSTSGGVGGGGGGGRLSFVRVVSICPNIGEGKSLREREIDVSEEVVLLA